MRWSPHLAIALAVLLAAACTAAPEADSDDEPAAVTEPTDTTDDPANEPSADPPEPDVPDTDALDDVWAGFVDTWLDQAAAEDPDPSAFDSLAVDPDAVVETLVVQRGESRLVTTGTELWPRFDIDGDRAAIVDCAIVEQHPDGQPDSLATVTIGWEATAIATDDGWRIQQARQSGLFCIAEELNDQLLAAYTSWLEGHREWYQPPDPEHPMLEATMAEPGLSDMRTVLAEDRDAGISMRFPHDTEAVVSDVAIGTARITDCYLAPEGYGAFDAETDERRTDIVPAPEAGQLNRTVADLELTAHGWRVIGWRWEEQNTCQPGETRYAPR